MRPQHVNSKIDALDWERQVTANAARPPCPEGAGSWALRLIHLPINGPETVWDFLRTGNSNIAIVTRFLEPLRMRWAQLGYTPEPLSGVPKEIGQAELPFREPVILEVEKGVIWGCRQGLEDRSDVDHYFLWYREADGARRIAAISNPFLSPHTESWQRLINRAIGAGLFPPRRFVADCAMLT